MSNKNFTTAIATAVIMLQAPVTQAHPLLNADVSWLAGFIHPLSGIDHVLAALAVGLWAAQQGGNKLWQLPATFLILIALGVLVSSYMPLPKAELAIVGSLLFLGIMVALAARLSTLPSLLMVGFFALFHGYAHGEGISGRAIVMDYTVGLLATTATLLCIGIMAGLWTRAAGYDRELRVVGLAIGMTGGWLCI